MGALLLLFACLLLGVAIARWAHPPEGMARALNWWVLYVALPAIVLELIPKLHFQAALWFPIAASWLVFFGAWALFEGIGRWRGWSRARIGTLVLVCGLGNTSFMGYPLVHALHGEEGLKLAVVADQLGTFPLLASAAIVVASLYAGRKPRAHHVLRKIFTFPAFLALLAGMVVGQLGGWPSVVDEMLSPIGATLTPLALFAVGMQFHLGGVRGQAGVMAGGLGWKLLAGPLLCLALGLATGLHGLVLTVGVLEAAMAPMISAAILVSEYELDTDLANSILGLGIVLSLLTVPLGDWLLTG
ncbi:AEC family transporter [Oleiagrimonas sp. MCCC 1A03011]|uniref:AEC family transporter n=1 Tax=Oleiagrimonas sp. MCCC 1A03011 TaxID=1926883 RepID=UPI00197CCDED|nr:AEC family transporter [Oleiagrimonas sp. MCCC 1A03011]